MELFNNIYNKWFQQFCKIPSSLKIKFDAVPDSRVLALLIFLRVNCLGTMKL